MSIVRCHWGGAAVALLVLAGVARTAVAGETAPIADRPFAQDVRRPFLAGEGEHNDVRALAGDALGRLWLATAGGFCQVDESGAFHVLSGGPEGPAYDVAILGDEVWGAAWNGLYRLTAAGATRELEGMPLGAIALAKDRIAVAGPDGLWVRRDGRWRKLPFLTATNVRDMHWERDDRLWVATGYGLYVVDVARDTARRYFRPDEIVCCDTYAICPLPGGRLAVGTNLGVAVLADERVVETWDGAAGLPWLEVRSLTAGPDDTLWIGTTRGLVRRDARGYALRHSQRWLPSDQVRDVACLAEGGVCAATSAGLSILETMSMTLADKAAHIERNIRARHVRAPGLVEVCRLRTRGDLSSWLPTDTDNDGLFTAQYLAAQCFRYAVTQDATARARARAAFDAIEFLQTITGTSGFIARTVIPAEWTEMADGNRTYTPIEAADERMDDPKHKLVEVRWRKSADGRWLWKGDTSSDEICGHYYGWSVFYDLVADEGEKARVRDLVRRVTDYIIEGGFTLRDIDGQPTQWAVWSPERLNGDPNWAPERNTNSIEILAHLYMAAHITGDDKYRAHAQELLERHNYRDNLVPPQSVDVGLFTHIDSQLLCLDFPALMKHAPDRSIFEPSLQAWFDLNRRVHSPFYNFTYGVCTGRDCDAEAGVEFLRDAPLDMIRWSVENGWRADLTVVRTPQSESPQLSRWLPPSERAVIKWDGNPYDVSNGNDGRAEDAGTFWLLPYWMGRHAGYIAAP